MSRPFHLSQRNAEELIATVLHFVEYATHGERFATRAELRSLLSDPMSAYNRSEGENIERAARMLRKTLGANYTVEKTPRRKPVQPAPTLDGCNPYEMFDPSAAAAAESRLLRAGHEAYVGNVAGKWYVYTDAPAAAVRSVNPNTESTRR